MTNLNKTTKIYLIRHGITDWIEQGRINGKSDRPLSAFGLEQAELTGKAMQGCEALHLYTSPLLRARQTAEPISRVTGLTPEIVEDLQEMYFGILEGKRNLWPKLKNKPTLLKLYMANRQFIGIFSGEKNGHFQQRIENAWEDVKKRANGESFIVVAHAGVLRTILHYEIGGSLSDPRFNLDACSISILEISPDQPTQSVQINGIAHLNGKVRP